MTTVKLREPTKEEKATIKEAARKDNVHTLQELTSSRVDVTGIVDDANHTALHFAADEGSNKVITFLLHHGAGVDDIDDLQYTPLHYAARYGHTDSVALLVASGADINMKNKFNMTPVEEAVEYGCSATVHYFVKTLGMDITKIAEEYRQKASELVKKAEEELQGVLL